MKMDYIIFYFLNIKQNTCKPVSLTKSYLKSFTEISKILTQVKKHYPGYKAVNQGNLVQVCKIWKWFICHIPFALEKNSLFPLSNPPSPWFYYGVIGFSVGGTASVTQLDRPAQTKLEKKNIQLQPHWQEAKISIAVILILGIPDCSKSRYLQTITLLEAGFVMCVCSWITKRN